MKLSRTNGRGLDLYTSTWPGVSVPGRFGSPFIPRHCDPTRSMAPASGTTRVACRHLPDADNPGDSGGEATPVPIPNTEVKLSSAEDTERAAFRENRSSPGLLHLTRFRSEGHGPIGRRAGAYPRV